MSQISKFIAVFVLSHFLKFTGFSQTNQLDKLRNIEVTGSSEMSIKPDELEMEFTLKEYYIKGTKEKYSLTSAEKEFFNILDKYGLKKKDMILDNSSFYWSNWYSWWKSKKAELKYKKITITIDSSINLLKLINDLDKDWLDNISIAKMKNKNEQNFRKEVKIQAIKAAKEKAIYLLSAIGEQPGKVISVEEIEGNQNSFWPAGNNILSNNALINTSGNSDEINNTTLIKLRYEIKVRFEIL